MKSLFRGNGVSLGLMILMGTRIFCSVWLCLIGLTVSFAFGQDREASRTGAVFNFEMVEGEERWKWLEKGLADMITNDLIAVGVNVVAREEMQAVAMQLRWRATELDDGREGGLVRSLGRAEAVWEALKIELLVSGVYEVSGDSIKIDLFVVDADTGKKLVSHSIAGPVDEVLELRALSSETVLEFLNGREKERRYEAEALAKVRPVPWSTNVDAMRALYEGIDLFDHGLYSEAWLKFRQSYRENPEFADAYYWASRMEYFLDRYQHARLSFGRFMERFPSHPMVAHATREYLHTHEKGETDTEDLLRLYDDIGERYPKALQKVGQNRYYNSYWTKWRAMKLQGEQGGLTEAVKDPKIYRWFYRSPGDLWARVFGMRYAERYGTHPFLEEYRKYPYWYKTGVFEEGQTEIVFGSPRRQMGPRYYLIAPEGKLFKSLHFYPIYTKGERTVLQVTVQQVKRGDVFVSGSRYPIAKEAMKTGIRIPSLAESPIADLYCQNYPGLPPYDKEYHYAGARIVAEFKDIPEEWGRLRITGLNCDDFRVYEGDNFLRSCSGEVAFMKPGKHKIQILPMSRYHWPVYYKRSTEQVFDPIEMEVEIEADETTEVEFSLPWRNAEQWQDWDLVSVDEPTEPEPDLNLETVRLSHSPCFVMEEERIRLVWSQNGDLYTCESDDGVAFADTRKLELPLSSVWKETLPRCRIDHQGRYVLSFMSDRDKDQVPRLYMAWSRDFRNWTSPRKVCDEFFTDYDFIEDPATGKLLIAGAADHEVIVFRPDDFLQWHPVSRFSFEYPMQKVRMLPPDDRGRYEIIAVQHGDGWVDGIGNLDAGPKMHHTSRWLSRDLETWVEDKNYLSVIAFESVLSVSSFRYRGQTLTVRSGTSYTDFRSDRCQFFWQNKEGQLQRSKFLSSWLSGDSVTAWSPKWGAYVATFGVSKYLQYEPRGPMIFRGPDFDAFLVAEAPDNLIEPGMAHYYGKDPHMFYEPEELRK